MADGPRHKSAAGRTLEQLGLQIIKQYPGPEQVELKVVADVPGSWFGGTLNTNERRECYRAQCVESAEVHEFPGHRGHAHDRRKREKREYVSSACPTRLMIPITKAFG